MQAFLGAQPVHVNLRHTKPLPAARSPMCATVSGPDNAPSPTPTPIPKRSSIPFLTPLIDLIGSTENTPLLYQKLGPVYYTPSLLPTETLPLIFNHPSHIRQIYTDSATFQTKGGYPTPFTQLLGNDVLLFVDDNEHTHQRSIVQPAFTISAVRSYSDALNHWAAEFWRDFAEQVSGTGGRGGVRLSDSVKLHLLRVIIRITTGEANVGQVTDEERLSALFTDFAQGLVAVPGSGALRRARRARDELERRLTVLVEKRREDKTELIERLREGGVAVGKGLKDGVDLITMMLVGEELDVALIVRLIIFLWFAGYSTQSNVVVCAVAKMKEGEWWRKLSAEVDEVKRREGGLTSEAVKAMEVLDMFVDEILRLYPPAPVIFRKCVKECWVGDYKVEEGQDVFLDLWSAGRRSGLEIRSQTGTDSYTGQLNGGGLAFGAIGGRHFCMGAALAKLSIKTLLAQLVDAWEMDLVKRQNLVVGIFPEVIPRSGVLVEGMTRRKVR